MMEQVVVALEKRIKNYKEDELLKFAKEYISAFVGLNFGGVENCSHVHSELLTHISVDEVRDYAIQKLAIGLSKPFNGVRGIENLWLAKMMLDGIGRTGSFRTLVWEFRFYNIWSLILNNREIEIKQRMDELADSIDAFAENAPMEEYVEFLLERVHSQMHYFEYSAAKRTLDKAIRLAGIERLDFGGALGKRTQFQQKSIPQLTLVLELESKEVEDNSPRGGQTTAAVASDIPQDCKSYDDTLLERISLDEKQERTQLNAIQTACILAMAILERHSNTFARELGDETTLVLLEEVILQQSCCAIQTRALVERSNLEMQNSRRVERAAAQLENIVRFMDDPKSEVDFPRRLELIFASGPLPFWAISKLYAKVLLSLGCISDALRMFEKLQLWEDVVQCYIGLRQPEKAEELVRTLLEHREEPDYYCLLGDITGNGQHFERAIQISNDRSARAQASLGKLMLSRKSYPEAFEHYKRSLDIQPLQSNVWFTMGYCAMKIGNYQSSVQAFHRCVDIEPEHFEAWNNLAASYIRLGQKHRAQKILQEALKLNWESPRVWENLLLVSVDIGDFKQAIGAIEKMMDMEKKKPVDELPLEIISTELLNSPIQPDGVDVDELKKTFLALLARVHSRQSLSPKVLRLYAALKRPESESENSTAWSSYVQLLERAFQKDFDQVTTSKLQQKYSELLEQMLALVDEWRIYWKLQKLQPTQMKSQLQIRLRPVIGFFEKEIDQNCDEGGKEELRMLLARIEELFI